MRARRILRFIGFAALSCAVVAPSFADPQLDTPSQLSQSQTAQPACASDGSRLGLSRVVEIDSSQGGDFGGSHGGRIDFLNDKEVVLTFDDGPLRPYTSKVLEALAKHCTKATFFMVGKMAVADPDMVKRVAREGHTVAGHTWSHKDLGRANEKRAADEIELGITAITKALGAPIAPFFRFPYLSASKSARKHIADRGISSWWIDVDSKDYLTRNADTVRKRVMSRVKTMGRGIILMHDIQRSTAGALDQLLSDLHEGGYKIVHIVPKHAGTTVAGYDDTVDKALAKKAKAARAAPLAKRAITWSADKDAADKPPQQEVLPWMVEDAATTTATIKKQGTGNRPAPKPAANDDVPWKPQLFGY